MNSCYSVIVCAEPVAGKSKRDIAAASQTLPFDPTKKCLAANSPSVNLYILLEQEREEKTTLFELNVYLP